MKTKGFEILSRIKQNNKNKTKNSWKSTDLKDPEVRKQKIQNVYGGVCSNRLCQLKEIPRRVWEDRDEGQGGRGRGSMGKNTCCVI